MKRSLYFFALALAGLTATPARTAAQARLATLTVPLIAQYHEYWCYAACVEMTASFLRSPVDQCTAVSVYKTERTSNVTCCENLYASLCTMSGGACDRALQFLGFTFSPDGVHSGPTILDFDGLEKQMQGHFSSPSPVVTTIYWRDDDGGFTGDSHQLVIRGTYYDDIHYILLNDPYPAVYSASTGMEYEGGDVYWYELDEFNLSRDFARVPNESVGSVPTDIYNIAAP